MPLSSMTGFARTEGTENGYSWSWEIRSVNARAIDVRLRTPPGMEQIGSRLKHTVTNRFHRGNFSATLSVTRPEKETSLIVNNDVLNQVIDLAGELARRVKANPPSVDGILSVKGVLDTMEEPESEEELENFEDVVCTSFEIALSALTENRQEEGDRLLRIITRHIQEIETLTNQAVITASTSHATIEQRLKAQVQELTKNDLGLSEERISQEVVLLVAKSDVCEELDRLKAHVGGAWELLRSDKPIGRKFDFLCQEFHREANTLCSKASEIELTRLGLDLKVSIERLREQIQNIE